MKALSFPIHGDHRASEVATTAYAHFRCYSSAYTTTGPVLTASQHGPKGNGWDTGTPGHLGEGQPPFAADGCPPPYPALPFHSYKRAKLCQKTPTKLPSTSLQPGKPKRSVNILLALDKHKWKIRNRNKMTRASLHLQDSSFGDASYQTSRWQPRTSTALPAADATPLTRK